MTKAITLSIGLSKELESLIHEYLKENITLIAFEMSKTWPYKDEIVRDISDRILRNPEDGGFYKNIDFMKMLVSEMVKKIDDDKFKMILLEVLIKK